jgi:hypothetical protein
MGLVLYVAVICNPRLKLQFLQITALLTDPLNHNFTEYARCQSWTFFLAKVEIAMATET